MDYPFFPIIAMLKVNIINYKTKSLILTYLFALAITNENNTIGNINIFKMLNIDQLSLIKKIFN